MENLLESVQELLKINNQIQKYIIINSEQYIQEKKQYVEKKDIESLLSKLKAIAQRPSAENDPQMWRERES